MELIIGLISGAVGGNVAGGVLKNLNQGTLINSLAGVVGGGRCGRRAWWLHPWYVGRA